MSKIVLYYYWAQHSPEEFDLTPEHLGRCNATHILVAFARLNATTLKLELNPDHAGNLQNVVDFKKQDVKVMIAIGRYNVEGKLK